MKSIFKTKGIIGLAVAALIVMAVIMSLFATKNKNEIATLDFETQMAVNYERLYDDKMSANKDGSVKFGAYFVKDLDGDGRNERYLGSCKNLNSSDTLILDLGVSGDGHLENGVITINSTNFKYKVSETKDTVLKDNCVSDNLKQIKLNTLYGGTQKLIMGTINSNIYNPNDYSKESVVTLEGTWVDKDGNEEQISKSCNLTVDWYGTATSKISYASCTEYSFGGHGSVENIDKNLQFSFTIEQDKGQLMIKSHSAQVQIPSLKNEYPVSVTCNKGDYTYDEENHILKINKEGPEKKQTYTVTLVYPDSVYEELIKDKYDEEIEYIRPVISGNFTCYNNPNYQNPYVTDTSSNRATIQLGGEGIVIPSYKFGISIVETNNLYRSFISKQNLLDAYDSEGPVQNIPYTVGWSIERIKEEPNRTTYKIVENEDVLEGAYLEQNYINCVGIHFGYTDTIPDDGIVNVYDNKTNELIKSFNKDELKRYTIYNPYYYNKEVKCIRVETTEDIKKQGSFVVYNMKEIDVAKMKDEISRETAENLTYLLTTATSSGSNIGNIATMNSRKELLCEKSYSTINMSPSYMNTSDLKPVDRTITINVPKSDRLTKTEWQNGIFLVEVPSNIVYMNIDNVTCSNNITIESYTPPYKIGDKYYIKIVTKNDELTSDFEIKINCKMQVYAMNSTSEVDLTLYSYNENCNIYANSTSDMFDLDADGNTSETIGSNTAKMEINAKSGFTTHEIITNYNEEEEQTVAPNVAEVSGDLGQATINVAFINNNTQNATNVTVLGKIPFEGNTYGNGQTLHSAFTALMTNDGIQVSEKIKNNVTIYYSQNENPTKDIEDESNGWIPAQDLEDLSNVKTYLIVIDGNIDRGVAYEFSYNVTIPQGITPNLATFSCHKVDYDLIINGGLTAFSVEPSKVGIRIAEYYNMEITKYKENTELPVAEAEYIVTELDEEGNETSKLERTSSDGKIYFRLRANQTYKFKEHRSPKNYSYNKAEIEFKVVERATPDGGTELVYECLSDDNFDGNVEMQNLNGNYTLKSYVYDEPRYQLNLTKVDKATNEKLKDVIISIGGKAYTTNSEGKVATDPLDFNRAYTLSELKADGYYLENIPFKVVKNEAGEISIECENEQIANASIVNSETEDLVQITFELANEKIPTYNLNVVKVAQNKNETDIEKLKKLKDAEFIFYNDQEAEEQIYITDENGNIHLPNLYQFVEGKYITGRYMLKEKTAPKGYSTNDEEIYFKAQLNADGNLELNVENRAEKTSIKDVIVDEETKTITLVLQDKPLFQLTKIDAETKQPLANVEFIISELNKVGVRVDYAKNTDGEYVGTKNEKDQYIVKTDETGMIVLPLRAGTYEIVEVKALDGYEEKGNTEYFVVTEDNDDGTEPDPGTTEPDPDPEPTPDSEPEEDEKNIIKISTIEELIQFSERVNGGETFADKTVQLTQTLDFAGETTQNFTPIGNKSHAFDGTFDGQGNEIKNINIDGSSLEYVGLFGKVENATIKNISVTGNIIGDTYTGGIAGYITGSNNVISNCYNKCTINGDDYAGGIIGCIYAESNNKVCVEIKDCNNAGEVTGKYIGGIVGSSWAVKSLKINNCNNTGIIDGSTYAGGIAGNIDLKDVIEITKCSNIGDIRVNDDYGYVARYNCT